MLFGSHAIIHVVLLPIHPFFLDMGTLLKRPAPTKQPQHPQLFPTKANKHRETGSFLEGIHQHLGVPKNDGIPKSSNLIGFSIINHPFWGNPYFWKHPFASLRPQWCGCHWFFGSFVAANVPPQVGSLGQGEVVVITSRSQEKGVKESVLTVYVWIICIYIYINEHVGAHEKTTQKWLTPAPLL